MRKARHLTALALVLLALALAGRGATPAAGALSLRPLPDATTRVLLRDADRAARPRAARVPGTISLSVERKLAGASPSTRTRWWRSPGGPGQAALPLGEFIAKAIAPALARATCSSSTSAAPAPRTR